MYTAETMARVAMPRLPVAVCRPSAMIVTEPEMPRPYEDHHILIADVEDAEEVPLPSGVRVVPFNIVPIDYVVRAVRILSLDPVARGRTFHLTDPNPVSTRRAFELFADIANRPLLDSIVGWWNGLPSDWSARLRKSDSSAAFLVGDLTQDVG